MQIHMTHCRAVVLTVAILVLTTAGSPGWAEDPVRGGTLNFLTNPQPRMLTSAFETGTANGLVSTKIHDGLINLDMNMQPQPARRVLEHER